MAFFPFLYEIFQIIIMGILLISLFFKKKWRLIGDLTIAVIIGLIIGLFNVFMTQRTYFFHPDFIFQIGSYPNNYAIVASFLWGTMIFFSMQISDRYPLSIGMKSILDGIIGMVTDLTIDIIAIRLDTGLWKWTLPLENELSVKSLLGVPYGNYLVWFLIMMYASLIIRIGRKISKTDIYSKNFLIYFLSIPIISTLGIFAFYNLSGIFQSLKIVLIVFLLIFFVLLAKLILNIIKNYSKIQKTDRILTIASIEIFHIFFIMSYLFSFTPKLNGWVLLISLMMSVITLVVIFPCYKRSKKGISVPTYNKKY